MFLFECLTGEGGYNIEDDKRRSLVQFDAGDESDDDKPGLKRHATPHPRDMKEMKKKIMEATQAVKESKAGHRNSFDAHKLAAIDGAVIPSNPQNRMRVKEVSNVFYITSLTEKAKASFA